MAQLYPFKVGALKLPDPTSAISAAHSLTIVARVAEAAEALALLLMLVKFGIAIAERTAKTATTTTISIRENPSSPGFVESAFLTFGLLKYNSFF
jgi:hypothetical protein